MFKTAHTHDHHKREDKGSKLTMNEIEGFNKELVALKAKLNHLKVSVFEENQSSLLSSRRLH